MEKYQNFKVVEAPPKKTFNAFRLEAIRMSDGEVLFSEFMSSIYMLKRTMDALKDLYNNKTVRFTRDY